MNPARASLPVIAISRSGPTAARIASHSAAVRWSFQRIAGRRTSFAFVEQHEAVHLAGQADRRDIVARRAGRGEDRPDRGDRAVPPEARAPARSRAAAAPRSRTPRRRPRGPHRISSIRTALVAVVETSIPRTWPTRSATGARLDPCGLVRGPDLLVHQVLEELLAPGRRMWIDLARGDLSFERRERRVAGQDRPFRARPPSRRSVPRGVAPASPLRSCRRRRGAPGPACRSRRCGRGTGPSGPGSGGAAWYRS